MLLEHQGEHGSHRPVDAALAIRPPAVAEHAVIVAGIVAADRAIVDPGASYAVVFRDDVACSVDDGGVAYVTYLHLAGAPTAVAIDCAEPRGAKFRAP